MGAYLYCVVPSGHGPPTRLGGLDRIEVEILEAGSVAAWWAELPRRPRATLEHLRTHDRVVRRALTEAVTPLPARFGQWFPEAATLASRVGESATEYGAALAAFAGAAEFGVVIFPVTTPDQAPAAPDPAVSSGRAYLQSIAVSHERSRAARERALQIQGELGNAVAHLVRDARPLTASPREPEVARVVHLVEGSGAAEYVRTVRTFQRPGIELVLTGPSPPYSFAP